ncbi:hypothetical protein GJR96_00625 [Haloferax sp. MBLA0076]|uniref:Uncharacterized protein n=1 Tax=Haloferax litoreum TaxID=2666140 RepID=A0A6A8GB74_9EURY|nr:MULTISPECIES: hypothetical protein [Haloferax]KAB1192021.1 hypothetical protein Hfx1148_00625 [Haloferax sp. CBA1148]MRX20463.1 hypothetical protein [Haloferax litoreum]
MVKRTELVKQLQETFGCTESGANMIADKAVEFEPIFEEIFNEKFTSDLIVSKMKSSGQFSPGYMWNWYIGSLSFISEVDADKFKVENVETDSSGSWQPSKESSDRWQFSSHSVSDGKNDDGEDWFDKYADSFK